MVPLKALIVVFIALLFIGTGLTLPLYKFDFHKFIKSAVFTKIIFWVPIFAIFIGSLYADSLVRVLILLVILVFSLVELVAIRRVLFVIYFLLFSISLSHLILLGSEYTSRFINILITLAFATVMADVTAYFFGNYAGKHKLPSWINPRKSWEGVVGELIGSLGGILLVNAFIQPIISFWLFIPIGLGSVLGDLTNSYFKRLANLKDWSRAIPGHGGVTDRLSSLAGSAMLTFYFLRITGL